MLKASTLRPGFLVSLNTTVSGNVKYSVQQLEAEYLTADGEARARWETEKRVKDPQEQKRATEARSKARWTVARVCATSAFGLLCPEDRAAELEAAIIEARKIAETFNVTANYTRIGVYVITGRVASDDVEAVRAINSEVQALLSAMEKGVQNLDATAIRDAANKARELGSMLSPDAQERMQVAIDAARSAARRIKKAGEGAALIIDTYAIGQITAARTAFIDLDDAREVAAPVVDGRAVDFTPDESTSAEIKAAFALDFDEPAPTKSAAPTAYGAALQLEF